MWSALSSIQTFFIWLMYSIMIIIFVLMVHKVNQYSRGLYLSFSKKISKKKDYDYYNLYISTIVVLIMLYGFWVFIKGVIDYDNRMLVGDFARLFLGELLSMAIVGIVLITFMTIVTKYINDVEAKKNEKDE